MLSFSPHPFRELDIKKVNKSLVGAIVVSTNNVSFHLFEANSTKVVDTYKVSVNNVDPCREGWAEQDAIAILRAVHDCIDNIVTERKVMGMTVITVGISNHRSSVLAWNKCTGDPLCNVILGSDNRTADIVDEYLKTNDKYRFQKICGLPFSPYSSAFKIKWLVDHEAKVKAALKQDNCYFGTIDSWLLWNLTGGVNGGVFATDTTNASNTFLMNITTLEWDQNLLKFFGIPLNSLPKIKTSSEVYGQFYCGPLANTPISGIIGDRQAALVGHRCFRRGLTQVILDGSGSVFTITGEKKVFSNNGLLTTIGYQLDTKPVFALEGPIASAGKSIEWIVKSFDIKENEFVFSSSKKDHQQNIVYFVPAFNGLYAPHWRAEARSILIANAFSNRKDIIKAAMESACFQTQDILEALNKDLKTTIKKIRINGELSNSSFIMQSLSNITNTKVEVAKFKDMTALGTAMAAGFASEINVWNAICMPEDDGLCFTPKINFEDRRTRVFDWKRAVSRSYNWVEYSVKKKRKKSWQMIPIISVVFIFGSYFLLK